jgi:hypothetical protein
VVADTLSYRDTEMTAELAAILAPSLAVLDDLHHEHAIDHALQALMKQVLDGEKGEHWQIVNELITSCGKVFVPVEYLALPGLLAHAHGCGHEGTEKTLHRFRVDFQVPDARVVVHDFVHACPTYQRSKTE